MKTPKLAVDVVKFGGATVTIKERTNGLWRIRWREAGKDMGTTTTTLEKAQERAKLVVRRLAGGAGKTVTAEEHELVEKLKRISGTRSPFAVLNQLDDAVRRMNGWDAVARALTFYEHRGMAEVQPQEIKVAKIAFLSRYEKKSNWTLAGLRKELDKFTEQHPGMMITEINKDGLKSWISRGDPAPRFFNNRRATWKTFLNFCREEKWWPKNEKHPAEEIKLEKLPDNVPDILTPEQAHAILKILPENLIPYFVIGSWLGLRPTEMQRLRWEKFDWERGYVDLDSSIVVKTGQQRFVPINDKARELLAT